MGHTLRKKREENRRKQIYYAPYDVRVCVERYAKEIGSSKSEAVVKIIRESWAFTRRS